MDTKMRPKRRLDMRKILIPVCLAIIVLAAFLASAAISSPNLDISQKSAPAKAGSFASSSAPSINVVAIDTGDAASGNSKPVNLSMSVTQFSSDSNQIAEAICGLDRSNFEIDTLEMPPGGKAARIMSVSSTDAYFVYASAPVPCSYWISIIPTTDYLNQRSPADPSPAKQNTWVSGIYTLRLRYMNEGSEMVSKTFSFTIGTSASLVNAAKFTETTLINSKLSPRDVDPISQLNPQPEPPMQLNPSFLSEKGNRETHTS
jgi:hypothetical protein